MGSKNASTQQPKKPLANDCQDCRVRSLCGTAIVECLMEEIRCQWAAHFRDGKICKHPQAKQFVNPAQP